jgi:hypothetical protein
VSAIPLGALVTAAALAAPLLCEAQSIPGFREAGQTARVRFFSRTSTKPNRSQIKRTDSFLKKIETDLGQALPEPIEYYRYERPEDIAVQTGVYATGLTLVGDTLVHSMARARRARDRLAPRKRTGLDGASGRVRAPRSGRGLSPGGLVRGGPDRR